MFIINKQFKGSLTRDRHNSSRKVINTTTGEVFDSVVTLSEKLGVGYEQLTRKLNGRQYNDTPYKLLNSKNEVRIKAPNNIKYINVQKFNLQGELVKTYKDITHLKQGVRSNLIEVLNKKTNRKIIDNSIWRATNVNTNEVLGFTEDIFKYYLYNSDMQLVTKFVNMSECLKYLGYSLNTAGRVRSKINKQETIKGYKIYENK